MNDSVLWFRHAGIFVGDGTAKTDCDVLVRGATIVAVGHGLNGPPGARVIEASGHTLLPGLIDTHVHLALDAQSAAPFAMLSEAGMAEAARRTLEAGFTTVCDLGAAAGTIFGLRDRIEAGECPGPRIVAAGRALTSRGGHGRQIGCEISGAAEAARAASAEIAAGAEVIKLMVTGGAMSPEGAAQGARDRKSVV